MEKRERSPLGLMTEKVIYQTDLSHRNKRYLKSKNLRKRGRNPYEKRPHGRTAQAICRGGGMKRKIKDVIVSWVSYILISMFFSALLTGFYSFIVLNERAAALVQVGLGFGGTWNGTIEEWIKVALTMFSVMTFCFTFVFAYADYIDKQQAATPQEEKK